MSTSKATTVAAMLLATALTPAPALVLAIALTPSPAQAAETVLTLDSGVVGTLSVPDAGADGPAVVMLHGFASNRDEIGAVIGGVSGAVIGGQVAGRDDRVVGMVVGGVLGAVLGHAIGDSMDARDRACMGHALELGRPGVPVAWRHDGHAYRFTPRGDARDGCRYATLVVDGQRPRDVLACPAGRGAWSFRRT